MVVPLHNMVSVPKSAVGEECIVKFNVTTLSQPFTVCSVSVYKPVDVYVLPYQSKLSQAVAVVSPIAELLIVRFKVTTLSQPFNVCSVSVNDPVDV